MAGFDREKAVRALAAAFEDGDAAEFLQAGPACLEQTLAELDRVTKEMEQYKEAMVVGFGALVEISEMTDLGGKVDERRDVVAAVKKVTDELDALRRCLFETVEEGGVPLGWEIQMDYDAGKAWPTNDPSEE